MAVLTAILAGAVGGGPLINFKPGGLTGRHLWRGTVGDLERFKIVQPAANSISGRPNLCRPDVKVYFCIGLSWRVSEARQTS